MEFEAICGFLNWPGEGGGSIRRHVHRDKEGPDTIRRRIMSDVALHTIFNILRQTTIHKMRDWYLDPNIVSANEDLNNYNDRLVYRHGRLAAANL